MVNYHTSVNFIHVCNKTNSEDRLEALSRNAKLPLWLLRKNREKILKIMDFVAGVDRKYHRYVGDDGDEIFLGGTFHNHISSDLRSSIVLGVTKQDYQSNIIIRHLIDVFIITLWADITCNFRGAFDYFIETSEWKLYRNIQRITWDTNKAFPNRSVKERLERIKILNFVKGESVPFYKKYFRTASTCELFLLLSLPICNECMAKKRNELNFRKYHPDLGLRKKGLEDRHSKSKSDLTLFCCFCERQKITKGVALGVPDSKDMMDMLKTTIDDDTLILNLAMLQKLYSHLSDDFVHFSTTCLPDAKPEIHDFDGKKGVIWGLDGTLFVLELLNPLKSRVPRKEIFTGPVRPALSELYELDDALSYLQS